MTALSSANTAFDYSTECKSRSEVLVTQHVNIGAAVSFAHQAEERIKGLPSQGTYNKAPLVSTAPVWHELVLGDLHVPLFLHDDLLVIHDNSTDHGLFLGSDVVQMDIWP